MARALQPVPDVAPRVLGLVRVSKERDGMISPEVQRAAITDYAAARGYRITGWLEGIDESGSRSRSAWWPRLDQAVAAVESGEYDVIVVWKYSRIARHRLRWAVAIDRVEEAGGRIESATERVDTTTSTGRLTRGMLAELQAFEAERVGEGWKEAQTHRVASGRPASGRPKYGYLYDRESKLHVPDPVVGPVLASLYRRYVAGESFRALALWMNRNGWYTAGGVQWQQSSLRKVMDQGFGSGRFTHRGDWYRGVHEPLIDQELWTSYQASRAERRGQSPGMRASAHCLSGLMRCAACGGTMTATKSGTRPDAPDRVRCARRQMLGVSACSGNSTRTDYVVAAVREWLVGVSSDVDAAADAAVLMRARMATSESDLIRVSREAVRVEEALTRLAVQNATHPLPLAVYDRARDELVAQLDALLARTRELESLRHRSASDVSDVAAGILAEWDELPVAVLREMLRKVVGAVTVSRGKYPVSGDKRRRVPEVRVVPVWDLRG